jgi:2-oxoglutarate dehydrogenase E2 component (dihydrolipoamide succinyltransferase)
VAPPAEAADQSAPDGQRQKSSPLVRKIAKEHSVDLTRVPGTGLGGRVTKDDILGYLGTGERPAAPTATPVAAPAPAAHLPAFKSGDNVEVVAMSVMRKKIAEHMVFSRRTSAHVHSVFEVDYTRVAKIREARKADYERQGVKLTYMSFLMKATVDALKAVPIINSSLDGDRIVYKKDINLGIAVALDWGLIVPVVKHAEERNVLGLSRAIQDLAARARSKQLKPDDVQGGTFTITNPGVFGALFGMPIISQPQVAIMGVGNIEKRVAVIDDAIAIRTKGYLSLGYDHRLIDGAVADEFMSQVKKTLENFDSDAV